MHRPTLAALAWAAATACVTPPPATTAPARAAPVRVALVAINDFHGHIEPPVEAWQTPAGPRAAGGAAYLAAHLARLRAEDPDTLVVSAGDLVGASPLASAMFHDEPAVEVMNALGLDLNAVGNHDFDEGADELVRLVGGGCHPVDGCGDRGPWTGARFATLGANVRRPGARAPMFPPYWIGAVRGVKVAFIGLGLSSTAVHQPIGFGGVEFTDEAATANALVPELERQGIQAIVVVVHEGLMTRGADMNACAGASGDLLRVVERLDPAVDLVISGHTHQAYVCSLGGRPVTSAGSYGRLYTRVHLDVDPVGGDVVAVAAENVLVDHDVAPDPTVAALVERWVTRSRTQGDRVVGRISADVRRAPSPGGDSPLGRLVADAQLEATRADGAVAALMHARGLRSELAFAKTDRETEDGQVTFAEVAAIHPFENVLVTLTLTGADLLELLDDFYRGPEEPRHLAPSASLSWAWRDAPRAVDHASVRLDGRPVDPAARYRVTVNDYLAGRGVLARGTEARRSVSDRDALVRYFELKTTVRPTTEARVRRVSE